MSREEHLTELVRQGQALRQEDINLGAKQERERIIKLLEQHVGYGDADWDTDVTTVIALIKGKK